jgi:hypothetical protein
LRPFPEQGPSGYYNPPLTINEVNSESIRQQIIMNYRVPGSGERFTDYNQQTLNYYMPTDNMFTTSREEDKKFEVFPEVNFKNEPLYKTSEMYETAYYRFCMSTLPESLLSRFPLELVEKLLFYRSTQWCFVNAASAVVSRDLRCQYEWVND